VKKRNLQVNRELWLPFTVFIGTLSSPHLTKTPTNCKPSTVN